MNMQEALHECNHAFYMECTQKHKTPWLPRHHVVLPLPTSHPLSSLYLALPLSLAELHPFPSLSMLIPYSPAQPSLLFSSFSSGLKH